MITTDQATRSQVCPQWLFGDPSLPSRDSSSKDATPRPKSGLEFSRQIPTPNRTLNARPPLTQTTIPRNRSRFCGTHLTPLAPSTSCKFSIQSCHHSSRFFLFLPNSSTFSFRPFIQGYRARELQDILVGRCCPRSSIIIKFWKPVSFSFSLRLNSPQKEKTLTFSSKIIRTDKDTLAHFFFYSLPLKLSFTRWTDCKSFSLPVKLKKKKTAIVSSTIFFQFSDQKQSFYILHSPTWMI